MNKFVFRPVGQGLFYTGSLLNGHYNFVYDCGSENNQKILNEEIKNYKNEIKASFNCKPIIDFVIVSHLHKDHYSGLYELLRNFRVNKIYLPYLGLFNENVLRLYIYYDLYVNNEKRQNQKENIDELYKLIESLYGLNDSDFLKDNIQEIKHVKSTEEIKCFDSENIYWEFRFLYNEVDQNKIAAINSACENFLKNANCENMQKFIEKNKHNINMIAQAYKQILGRGNELNNTSILLLHNPKKEVNSVHYTNCDNCKCIRMFCDRDGCYRYNRNMTSQGITLLTGDIKFNVAIANELKSYIEYKKISVLQIPHHGSISNWDAFRKHSINSEIYVISFGHGNRYGHPNIKVIGDLICNNNEYYFATQNNGFAYVIN